MATKLKLRTQGNKSKYKRYVDEWAKVDPNSNPEESHLVAFDKTFDAVKIDEKFCKNITQRKFNVLFINADDGKVMQTYSLDFSSKYKNI